MSILWNSLRECHLHDSLKALYTDRWLISITNSCGSTCWSPWLTISSQEQLYYVFFYCSRCHSMWSSLVLLTDQIPSTGKVSLLSHSLRQLSHRGLWQALKIWWFSCVCLICWAFIGDLHYLILSANFPHIEKRRAAPLTLPADVLYRRYGSPLKLTGEPWWDQDLNISFLSSRGYNAISHINYSYSY